MRPRPYHMALAALLALLLVALSAQPSLATQTHGEPEGLVVHQLAHVFFCLSMGIFVFWLHRHRLTGASGWRLIQYAALLLILWNLDAMVAHFLDEQVRLLTVTQVDTWHIRIDALPGYESLGSWYYMAKLDHLISVPALLLLYLGLRRLTADIQRPPGKREQP
ncbi:MAG: hypothetical protein ABIL58_12500 [Pseudomonadota bacterium]